MNYLLLCLLAFAQTDQRDIAPSYCFIPTNVSDYGSFAHTNQYVGSSATCSDVAVFVRSVVCTTNTVPTSGDNASGCPMFGLPHFNLLEKAKEWEHFEHCTPRTPATEKWETTVVTERRTLTLEWDGKIETIVREKELSRVTKRWKVKATEWEEAR